MSPSSYSIVSSCLDTFAGIFSSTAGLKFTFDLGPFGFRPREGNSTGVSDVVDVLPLPRGEIRVGGCFDFLGDVLFLTGVTLTTTATFAGTFRPRLSGGAESSVILEVAAARLR